MESESLIESRLWSPRQHWRQARVKGALVPRGHPVHALSGEGGTRLEDGDDGGRQSRAGERASAAAPGQQVHLEEGVPVHHGEVSCSISASARLRAAAEASLRPALAFSAHRRAATLSD